MKQNTVTCMYASNAFLKPEVENVFVMYPNLVVSGR